MTTARTCRRKRQRDGRKESCEKVTRRMNVDPWRWDDTGIEDKAREANRWGNGVSGGRLPDQINRSGLLGDKSAVMNKWPCFYSHRSKGSCTPVRSVTNKWPAEENTKQKTQPQRPFATRISLKIQEFFWMDIQTLLRGFCHPQGGWLSALSSRVFTSQAPHPALQTHVRQEDGVLWRDGGKKELERMKRQKYPRQQASLQAKGQC